MKKLILLSLLVVLSGCKWLDPTIPWYDKIRPNYPVDAPPDYKQGWQDGCETGYTVFGNHMYKTFHGFKRDATKVGNYQYEVAWYNGYHYCRQSINVMVNDGVI